METYALICGAWGDIIVSLKELRQTNIKKVVVASKQFDIENFLYAQGFIEEIIKIDFSSAIWNKAVNERADVTDYISDKINKKINLVNCSFNSGNNYIRYDLLDNLTTDEKSKRWANEIKQELPEKFILFYPYSLGNSAPKDVHWPHWKSLLKYLLDNKKNVVLCGFNFDFSEFDKYDNFIDLSNSTSSFQQVFALSHHAEQIISTHNGLSFYCSSNNFDAAIVFNAHADNIFNGFNRSIQNVKKISYNDTLLDAISILSCPLRKDTFNQIISSFPYLHKTQMYENITEKNKYCLLIQNNKLNMVYSEKGFLPDIIATLILNNNSFVYHMKLTDEEDEFKILENVKYLSNKYKCDIDFKILNQKSLDYDIVIE